MALSPAGRSTVSSVTSPQQLLQIGGKIDGRTPEDLAIIFGRGQFVGTVGRDLAHPRADREGHLDQIVERRLIARGAERAIILRPVEGLQALVGGENAGATRAHDVPCHLEHAEPHRIQERRDDPLLAEALLGREIERVDLVQGVIRGLPHHALEHVHHVVVGRLTQRPKQGLGFAHPTMLHESKTKPKPALRPCHKLLLLAMPQTGSGSERLDRDCIAEVGQTFDQALFLSISGTSIEVIAAEVLVHRAVFEHVVDRSKDRGRDGHDRLFGATTGFDAVELGLQITVFLFYRRPGALH